MTVEPFTIYIGLGIGIPVGIFISNLQGYYMVKKELIEECLMNGKEYAQNYAEQIYRTSYYPRLSKILNIGPKLACERFKSGKFDTIINNIALSIRHQR